MFSGPLIWAAHFLAVYVLVALACARHFADVEWFGADAVSWGIGMATLAGLAGIAAVATRVAGNGAGTSFVSWTTMSVGGLSALAIVWETIPALIMPMCV